ncbi:probable oxidation resistance protein 1 [Rhynchosporium agropyri]|uniref:Oxidation resistance protein 1 n=1 Tax=Rhynchosporium agropyri TaxID=914238 RepID=A0A1E1LDL8_9HELO|nr:probable oxidation resistance protein 1 [Rhynchosporium agropyri]
MERNYKENTSSRPPSLSASGSWAMPSMPSMPSTVSHAVTGLLRRFSTEPSKQNASQKHSPTYGTTYSHSINSMDGVYTPPYRTASPFQPPPLYPVNLQGYDSSTPESAKMLSRALAEEIRLLVPPRLQLCEEWNLVYSLEEDGVSLGTLYKKCDELRGLRNGFVLVVKDREGGLFGAYLTEAPHPAPHYFGTGECFLWRASILSANSMPTNLPPPPSADTTHAVRSTTVGSAQSPPPNLLSPTFPSQNQNHNPSSPAHSTYSLLSPSNPHFPSSVSTPERIRFKAFPYSGINDYMMLCETGFLSVGGGDGHYGLWLDDTFEKGISSHSLTFGNEPLSEEGEKFGILGVELWSIGNS